MLSQVMADAASNDGFVDRVTVTFSESLNTYSAGLTPWTLTNVPSGSVLTAAARGGATMVLTLGTPTGAADTALGSFKVALAANAAGVRDTAGNLSSYAATAPSDGARPVPLSLSGNGGTTVGRIQPGDTLSVLLSEALGASVTLPASTTVTMTDPKWHRFGHAEHRGSVQRGALDRLEQLHLHRQHGRCLRRLALHPERRPQDHHRHRRPDLLGHGVCRDRHQRDGGGRLHPARHHPAGNAPTTTARNITYRLL